MEVHKHWPGSQDKSFGILKRAAKKVKKRGEIKLEHDLQFTKWTSGVGSQPLHQFLLCAYFHLHSPDVEREIRSLNN